MLAIREYHRPERLEEALKLLKRNHPNSAILAGGTQLLSSEFNDIEAVIDLQAIGLDKVRVNNSTIEIGSMVRLQEVINHPDVPEFLAEMALREGPNTFRNSGTMGGTIVTPNPNSEFYAALLTYGAIVTVQNDAGLQRIPLADFSVEGVVGAIITAVTVERSGSGVAERVARTPADDPIVAVVGRKTGASVPILAFCGIRDRPLLANEEEVASMNTLEDFQGSSDYRRNLALILAKRVKEKLTEGQ